MTQYSSDYINSLGLSSYGAGTGSPAAADDSLGQGDFLNLLITQLQSQDPTSPVKNEDFVAQLAQFSTVSGVEALNSAFQELSQTLTQNQTLQAASLVGNKVLVPADSIELEEGQPVSGAFYLNASASSVNVDICNAAGETVKRLTLSGLSAGLQDFEWDGQLDDGTPAPAGTYQVKVTAQGDGESESLATMLEGQVQSVTTGSDGSGLVLGVLGIGSIPFSAVYRIG